MYQHLSGKNNIVLNWSSGKDAALAYHLLQQNNGYNVAALLTTLSEEHNRVFMHGIREELLDMQAVSMNLPIIKIKLPASPDDNLYKQAMLQQLTDLRNEGITGAAFGDIFLEDLRHYREEQLKLADIKAIFPLWKRNTGELVHAVSNAGIEAIIVCVNDKYLGKEFLGRKIDAAVLKDLPDNVDPCGENGEFHTFVYNAPFFTSPLSVTTGDIVYKQYTPAQDDDKKWGTGFYFLDVKPL